jgi:hypothetical protein
MMSNKVRNLYRVALAIVILLIPLFKNFINGMEIVVYLTIGINLIAIELWILKRSSIVFPGRTMKLLRIGVVILFLCLSYIIEFHLRRYTYSISYLFKFILGVLSYPIIKK